MHYLHAMSVEPKPESLVKTWFENSLYTFLILILHFTAHVKGSGQTINHHIG